MPTQRPNEATPLIFSPSMRGKDDRHDDAVLYATKRLIDSWIFTISLWFVSYLLVMLRLISDNVFAPSQFLIFIPMWLGNFYGVISLILIIKKLFTVSRLITDEEMNHIQIHDDVSKLYDCIAYDSMPLLRRFVFYAIVSGLSLVLTFISQVCSITVPYTKLIIYE